MVMQDASGQIIWTNYFIESLGYQVNCTVVYQDNQSAILLEKNGKKSSSRQTRHMNINYFFLVKSGELEMRYFPTGEMLPDHFTKPLQSTAFYKFRSQIMNIDPGLTSADLAWDQALFSSPSPQECVGDPSSCHAKDHMSPAKHRMDSAKGDTGNANTGGRGIDIKALRHETVYCIPLLAVEKIAKFHDPVVAAA